MLLTHEIFRLPDENKEKTFLLEVNWNPSDKKTNECQMVRITSPGGETAVVRREHLLASLFAIGRPADQRKMVPQTLTHTRKYETLLGVTATHDIRKGEKVNFKISIPLPPIVEHIIGEVREDAQRGKK